MFTVFLSCGHNNNQSEGAADSDEDVSASSLQSPAAVTDTSSSATDTVIKSHNSDPGEGSNISGTGKNQVQEKPGEDDR